MSKQTDLINVTDAITVSGSNVGIGTSSPLSRLNLKGTQGNWRVDPDSVSGEIQVLSTTPANDGFRSFRLRSNESIFETNGTERMRITSSGNVGIGISPVTPLDVVTGSNQRFFFTQTNGSPIISAVNKANTAYMPLQLNGLDLRLQVSGTERMRIDSSGNLLVGKTSANATDVGIVANANGRLYATASGDSSIFNRTSSDGDIVQFRKDGSTVGSIGVNSGDQVYFAASDGMGIKVDTDNTSVEASNAAGADNDNAVNLGSSGTRWKDLYLSGGVNIYNGSTDSVDIRGTGSRCEIDNPDNNSVLLKTGGTTRVRIDANGLLFGSDTAAANALNDYEEGTYTPVFDPTSGSATASSVYGSYTKVGDLVQVQLRFSGIIISGSPSGYLRVTLPFTCATGVSSVAVSAYNMNSAMNAPNTEIIHNNNRMYLFGFNNGTRIDHTAGLLNTGGQLIFGGTYRTS